MSTCQPSLPQASQIFVKGPTTARSVSHLVLLHAPIGDLLSRPSLRLLRGRGPPLDRDRSWIAQGVRSGDTLQLVCCLYGGVRGEARVAASVCAAEIEGVIRSVVRS